MMPKPKEKDTLTKRYGELKKQLLTIGFICQGSVSSVYQKCGRPSCRCHQDPKSKHGPYFLWTRKIKGKTVSRFLNDENGEECKEWIANHRQLEAIIKEMRDISKKAADWHR